VTLSSRQRAAPLSIGTGRSDASQAVPHPLEAARGP